MWAYGILLDHEYARWPVCSPWKIHYIEKFYCNTTVDDPEKKKQGKLRLDRIIREANEIENPCSL